jgi:hypothetical protein
MGARTRLNEAYVLGSLVLSAGLGLLSGSWIAFGASLLMLLVLSLQSKRIRPNRPRCRCRNR